MNKNKKGWEAFIESEISKVSLETGIPMFLKRNWYDMSWWEWTLTIVFAPLTIPMGLFNWLMGDLKNEDIDAYKKGFRVEGEYYKYSREDLSDSERAEEMAKVLIWKIEKGDYSILKLGGKG